MAWLMEKMKESEEGREVMEVMGGAGTKVNVENGWAHWGICNSRRGI